MIYANIAKYYNSDFYLVYKRFLFYKVFPKYSDNNNIVGDCKCLKNLYPKNVNFVGTREPCVRGIVTSCHNHNNNNSFQQLATTTQQQTIIFI